LGCSGFYNRPKLNIGYDEAMLHTEDLLKTACRYRMVSDVPVGVFLSGGYDSSTVAALLQSETIKPIETFTIGFEDDVYDEAKLQKK
jgi:asparagine synthase (glutamine-hydrolysing)